MMRSRARVFIRNHVSTYLPYLRLMGYYDPVQLPNDQSDIHIGGYPRSANSFCTVMLQHFDPGLSISHHVHTVVTLKLARRHRVPSVVLIRNPSEAVSSNIVRMGEGKRVKRYYVDNAIWDYVTYHEYLSEHRDEFSILDFKTVVTDPASLFRAAADLGVFPLPPDEAISDAYQRTLGQLRADGRKPEMRNLPNERKEQRKREVREFIEGAHGFERARRLYTDLSPIASGG